MALKKARTIAYSARLVTFLLQAAISVDMLKYDIHHFLTN